MKADGIRLEEFEINGANIFSLSVGTNGYKGGDAGHGSRTFFRLADSGGTSWTPTVDADGAAITVELAGDSELTTFIEALESAAAALRRQANRGDLPHEVANEIHMLTTELVGLGESRWDQRQNRSGATRLRELATRIVLSAKRVESLVKEHTFPAA